MGNWSDLPVDVVYEFARRLPNDVKAFANFGSVSKSWNSAVICVKEKYITCSPWLMLTDRENDVKISEDNELGFRSFYDFSTKKIHKLELPTQGRRCYGTPYEGWVFTIGLDLKINLLNLLSGAKISLPPQSTFEDRWENIRPDHLCETFIKRVAMASNPSHSDHNPLVILIHGEDEMSIARPGAEAWTLLEESGTFYNYEDVIFFNGQFYIINYSGCLGVVKVTPNNASIKEVAPAPDGVNCQNRFYLVEMAGDLYFVERAFIGVDDWVAGEPSYVEDGNEIIQYDKEVEVAGWNEFHNKTTHFNVFKYNSGRRDWATVENLGDRALFVGNNTSFTVSTRVHPDFNRNCVYFTDDHIGGYEFTMVHCDMGVYNLSLGKVEPIYVRHAKFSLFSRPFFFVPTYFVPKELLLLQRSLFRFLPNALFGVY